MKFTKILLFPSIFLLTCGFLTGCHDDKEEKTFIGYINDKSSFEQYLNYTSTYTEHGSDGAYYLLFSVNIYSLNEDYYFEDCKATFNADGIPNKYYNIPTNGNVQLNIQTQNYKTKESMNTIKLLGCKVVFASGQVYKKN